MTTSDLDLSPITVKNWSSKYLVTSLPSPNSFSTAPKCVQIRARPGPRPRWTWLKSSGRSGPRLRHCLSLSDLPAGLKCQPV